MKLQFQKQILSRFNSILVHFTAVDFSLDFNQNSGHKMFWVQHISENKAGSGEEGGERGSVKFYWKWCRCRWGQAFKLVILRTPVPPTDSWALSSDLWICWLTICLRHPSSLESLHSVLLMFISQYLGKKDVCEIICSASGLTNLALQTPSLELEIKALVSLLCH